MRARTYETILKAMIAVIVIGGILFFVLTFASITEIVLRIYFFSFLASFFLWHMALSFVLVRCDKPGCIGRMRHNWVKESDYESKLQYVCDNCGDVYDTNISMKIGGGEAW